MRYLLLGAGLQGTAIAFDLIKHAPGTAAVTVCDGNGEALDRLAARLDDERLTTVQGNVNDAALMGRLMGEAAVTISAVNYWYNADLAAAAVAAGSHFLDLGGNNDIVAREFALDTAARGAGVAIIPDCGLAPGLAGILGFHLAHSLARCESLHLRVGGLPAAPRPPLNYKIVFSVQGLINEYIEPAVVIRDGEIMTVPSLTELETLHFPAPFGELEAFQTSGGTSTLPQSLLGKVRNLDYKTIRYPGHCERIRLLQELGLCSSDPIEVPGGKVAPREVLARLMDARLRLPGTDVVLLLATAHGWDEQGRAVTRRIRIVDHEDTGHGITAMMRMTGFPAAIIAHMLCAGVITARGALRQEEVVPAGAMIDALRDRNTEVEDWTEQEPQGV